MRKVLAIAEREFADNIRSRRLLVVTAIFFFYFTAIYFLVLRSLSENLLVSLITSLVGSVQFVASILGLIKGYDVIAGDRERGILKLVLARLVYREDVINGKALGAIASIALVLFSAFYLMLGVAISLTGVAVTLQDLARAMVSLVFITLYAIAYYSIAQFFSVLSNKASRSLVLSLAIWFLFTIILPIVAVFVSFALLGPMPVGAETEATKEYFRKMTEIRSMITSITPEFHINSIIGALNSVYEAELYTSLASTSTEGPGNQTEVISEIISGMKIYPNMLDALAASWVNIVALIVYVAVFYIASYMAFVARKIEKPFYSQILLK
mgnify:CR=1 FL=1